MREFLEDFLNDPPKYLFGAIMIIMSIGLLIRFGKDIWKGVVNDD